MPPWPGRHPPRSLALWWYQTGLSPRQEGPSYIYSSGCFDSLKFSPVTSSRNFPELFLHATVPVQAYFNTSELQKHMPMCQQVHLKGRDHLLHLSTWHKNGCSDSMTEDIIKPWQQKLSHLSVLSKGLTELYKHNFQSFVIHFCSLTLISHAQLPLKQSWALKKGNVKWK